jgi:hypothetical protein
VSTLHYVVEVSDRRNAQLTGGTGGTYRSPPHTLDHAHELVAVLLDFPGGPIQGEGPWRRAVPGGERVVSLVLADTLFDPRA